MNEGHQVSIFQKPVWVAVFALTAAMAWGWAFPLIKVGFSAFGITTDMTGSKMLFAGIRFASAGLIILSLARSNGRSFRTSTISDWRFILAFALMNTTLHYFFFYVGMSHSEGSRAAILNSLSTFLVVLLACACFKSDKLTCGNSGITGCTVELCTSGALCYGLSDRMLSSAASDNKYFHITPFLHSVRFPYGCVRLHNHLSPEEEGSIQLPP